MLPAFMPTKPVTLQHTGNALRSFAHHCIFKLLGHLLAHLRHMYCLHHRGRLGKHSLMHVACYTSNICTDADAFSSC